MHIYSFPTFNLTKVLLTAEEAEVPYTLHLLDLQKGEHKSPEHMARHPLGKVPAVEIEGTNYFESNAICRLIAEKYAPSLYADTPEKRAMINLWLDFMSQHIGRWIAVPMFEETLGPAFLGRQPDAAAIAEAKGYLDEQLPVLDQQLAQDGYLANGALSIADLVGCCYFETIPYCSVDLDSYPNIVRWLDTLQSRPAYARAVAGLPGGKTFGMVDQA